VKKTKPDYSIRYVVKNKNRYLTDNWTYSLLIYRAWLFTAKDNAKCEVGGGEIVKRVRVTVKEDEA
jgi:hypothetical protein